MSRNSKPIPHRIVSLAPSATSILCSIGAKRHLVGVTKWCADVASVGGLPKLGDCWHLKSVHQILALRPTLVIGSVPYRSETVAALLQHPLNFLAMNPRTLADIDNDIRLLAGIVGRAKQGERLIRTMQDTFTRIAASAKAPPLRVYCEAWPNPRISSPPWVAEVVRIAGGTMAVPAGAKIADQQVADAQPEVIILAWAATKNRSRTAQAYKLTAWRNVPAIRNRHVYVLRDEWLNTPGPPLVRGALALHEIFRKVKRARPAFSASSTTPPRIRMSAARRKQS
jgi:iron complex transport system substrate-binding protein